MSIEIQKDVSLNNGHLKNGSSDASRTNGNAVCHYGDYLHKDTLNKRDPEER